MQYRVKQLSVVLVFGVKKCLQHVILALGLSPCLDGGVEQLLHFDMCVITTTETWRHHHHHHHHHHHIIHYV